MPSTEPAAALRALAKHLRAEDSPISSHVIDPATEPELGLLAASGARGATDPGEYALVVESVREGYLLHYGEPRLLVGHDSDLALLAGDYLYALGLQRLAVLGDVHAVRELADLISLSAQLQAEGRGDAVDGLWRAAARAVGNGADAVHAAPEPTLPDPGSGP